MLRKKKKAGKCFPLKERVFEIAGTKEEAVLGLCNLGIEEMEAGERILDYLAQNSEFLSDEEHISEKSSFVGENDDMEYMSMLFSDTQYYVSLKITTIVLVALLLDIRITKGLAAAALSLAGIPSGTVFAHIDEHNGEKCILKEILRRKSKDGNRYLLDSYDGKCVYPVSCCRFRNGENCDCTNGDVKHILEVLREKNVLKTSSEEGHYVYRW